MTCSFNSKRSGALITALLVSAMLSHSAQAQLQLVQGTLNFAPKTTCQSLPSGGTVCTSDWPVPTPNAAFEITQMFSPSLIAYDDSAITPPPSSDAVAINGGTAVHTLHEPHNNLWGYHPFKYDYYAVVNNSGPIFQVLTGASWIPGDPIPVGHVVAAGKKVMVGGSDPCQFGTGGWACNNDSEPVMSVELSLNADLSETATVSGTAYRIDDLAQFNIAQHFGATRFDLAMLQELGSEAAMVAGGGDFTMHSLEEMTLSPGESLAMPIGVASVSPTDLVVIQSQASDSVGVTDDWLAVPMGTFMAVPEPSLGLFPAALGLLFARRRLA